MKRFFIPILIFILFAAGIGVVAYPVVSNYLYEKNQSRVTAQYDETVSQMAYDTLAAERKAAQEYNQDLLESKAFLTDPFDPDLVLDPKTEPYASLLNVEGNGIMGYIVIPKISVNLPIFHGTTADVLSEGVGHLQNSSLPVGGESTHTVLTGHTGISGKRLFTDLTLMEEGDIFYLHVLGDILAYQVDEIKIVDPDQTENLVVESGRDLATLVTCYPYGINTQRLLVQGTRIPYEQAQEELAGTESSSSESVWKTEYEKAIIVCLAVYVPLTAVLLFVVLHGRKRKKEKQ